MRKIILMMAVLLSSAGFTDDIEDNQISTEVVNNKSTALFMISSAGDYVGAGQNFAYLQGQDGKFTIWSYSSNVVTIHFRGARDWWQINFSAPEGQSLQQGLYENAQRYPFNREPFAGFSLGGCGRGCNTSDGEFEILEITYGEKGQVESFAADFIQKCEVQGPALCGSIRFNSALPIENRFKEVFEHTSDAILYSEP